MTDHQTTPVQDADDPEASLPAGEGATTWWQRTIPTIAWGLVFAFIPVMLATFAIETAMHFGGPPIDGPFQVYNALRRIMAGQHGGTDFQFFHGIALPYLVYIPFRLMGGSFAASELSRQLIATLSGPAVLLTFFRIYTNDWKRAFALSTIVLALSITLGQWPMILAVNSLLVLRAALPTLTPVIWVLPIRPRLRAALMGAAIGGSILLGTEQGLAVLAAFLIVSAIATWRSSERRARTLDAVIALATVAATLVAITAAIGGWAGIKGALYYNLKLVPTDQYWYFGAPPNLFLTGWTSVIPRMIDQPTIPIALALGLIVAGIQLRRVWRARDGEQRNRHAATAMLIVYGLIACASLLGIFLVSYVEPCIRALLMIGALEVEHSIARRIRATPPRPIDRILSLGTVATAALLLMATLTPERSSIRTFPSTIIQAFVAEFPHVIVDHGLAHEGMRFGGLWPATINGGQRILDAHRGPDGKPPTLWSTYAGLLEARNGLFHPSTDYIIHVLGPENRAQYVADFRRARPTLVQTVRPTYSEYEMWIEQTSWDFYAELLQNYRTVDATPWSIFWERLPAPAERPRDFWTSAVPPGAHGVEIPLPQSPTGHPDAMLVQVELTYRVHNPLGKLPIIGAMPRYLVTVSGAITGAPVTIDPYTTTARFPIVAVEGRRIGLGFAAYSLLPGADIEVTHVRASQIAVTRGNLAWLYDLAQSVAPSRSATAR